jgi:hypothetical protein
LKLDEADSDHLQEFFEICSEMLCVVGADGKIVLANPALADALGRTPEALESRTFLDLVHEDDRREIEPVLVAADAGGKSSPFTIRCRGNDGAYRRIEWTCQRHPRSRVSYLLGHDVTDEGRMERALQESEHKVQALFENAAQGIVVVTEDGTIDSANSMAESLFGYERNELLGMSVERLLPESRTHDHARYRTKYFDSPRARPMGLGMDLVARRKDGTEFPVEISLSHVRSSGRPRAVAFVNDITARKQAESDKKTLEQRLEHATKMEAVGRLAGGIAHDFNNLLTALSGFAEVVLDELPEDHALYEGAKETLKTCQRSTALVRRLLAMSRRQMLQPEVLDLNAKIGEIEKVLRSVLGEDIELLVKPATGLGFVRADQSQIEQVILNLVVNARDAMPQGGRLTIETENVDIDETMIEQRAGMKAGAYVLASVSDTGHGMDAETLEHIFEPFFTTKEKGKGTGLGLATVYGIVNQSEGTIWADSAPKRGTTFKMYLPRVDRGGKREDALHAPRGGRQGSETILVVEDENSVRLVAVNNLKKAGYHVLEARDGEEALSIAERFEGKIHLVLTDVIMPRLNGPALVARLSAKIPGLKALYMSGHADDALIHHGILEGEIEFLDKPFTRDDLTRRVREVLDENAAT